MPERSIHVNGSTNSSNRSEYDPFRCSQVEDLRSSGGARGSNLVDINETTRVRLYTRSQFIERRLNVFFNRILRLKLDDLEDRNYRGLNRCGKRLKSGLLSTFYLKNRHIMTWSEIHAQVLLLGFQSTKG